MKIIGWDIGGAHIKAAKIDFKKVKVRRIDFKYFCVEWILILKGFCFLELDLILKRILTV